MRKPLRLFASIAVVSICCTLHAQSAGNAPQPTVKFSVVALDNKTNAILPNLSKEDFRLLVDNHEVPIVSFGSGAHYSVSPIGLWLVLECNNFGVPEFASAFMRGKTQYLLPALAHLDKADTLGVAHWCGNGTQAIDLPPRHDPQAAIAALNNVLKQKPIEGANRQAEDAKQRMVEMILADAKSSSPRRVPVIVFLYGDGGYSFQYKADDILSDVISTRGVIYGLNDAGYRFDPQAMFGGGEVYYEIHYLSQATGGDVVGTPYPKKLSTALDYILLQQHFRYTLGFEPTIFDGKKHDLKVELTPSGIRKYANAVLRYRSQFIAVAPH